MILLACFQLTLIFENWPSYKPFNWQQTSHFPRGAEEARSALLNSLNSFRKPIRTKHQSFWNGQSDRQ